MIYANLNPEKALIWRIVHRANLPWLLANGIHCSSSPAKDPNFVSIGNADLISRRATRSVEIHPGGFLADYVPFYFTPFSPMMYNIHTGHGGITRHPNQDICILVSSIHRVAELGLGFVFTDRHAYPPLARYFNDVSSLDQIDWPLLQARNFRRNPEDPVQIERYQAEALIYRQLPVTALLGVVCYDDATRDWVDQSARSAQINIDVRAIPGWYF